MLGNLTWRTTVLGLQNLFLFSNVSVILATKALHLLLLLISMFFLPLLSLVSSCPCSLLVSPGRGRPEPLCYSTLLSPLVCTAGNTCLTTSESP